jgi:hypothetical protein
LIDSGLGGSCAANAQAQVPGNDGQEGVPDVPVADEAEEEEDSKPAAKPTLKKENEKTMKENINDITKEVHCFDIDTKSEMLIKVFHLLDVEV